MSLALSITTASSAFAQTTPTNPAITGSFVAPVAKPLADGKPGFWVAPATIPLSATITAASGNKITEVQFYADSPLIATMTAPAETNGNTYKTSWQSVAANSYTLSVKAKDDKGNTYSSAPVNLNVISNAAPQISLTVSPNSATAPATLILSAKASDTDGSISQVEFYNGTTKLTSQTQPASDGNYRYNWSNVAAGNYSLTVKATDNLGTSTTSTTQSVKVASDQAQLYDIHSDQLGTPRLITDASGQEVWRWDSAPFGETAPNENPNGKGKFEFNLRFPGQYYDKETGLHYNYFRDYDPQTGRYVQSDPIGLDGGINTYGYVGGNPTSYVDPSGEYFFIPYLIKVGLGATTELFIQGYRNYKEGCDWTDWRNYDWGDVVVGGWIGGVAPGLGRTYTTVKRSYGAISNLAKQATNTANRAQKISNRIASHKTTIYNTVGAQSVAMAGAYLTKKSNGDNCECRK